MDITQNASSSSLPSQKVTTAQRTEAWKKSTLDYYLNFRYTNGSNLRTDRSRKITNYDLYNGVINKNDVEAICNPLGYTGNTWADKFMHYDKISEPIRLLIGEESARPDNSIVISEAPDDINRKQSNLKKKLIGLLQQQLMAEIDPSTVDPNNPPPTPEQIIKAEKYSPSDQIESKANRLLKILKKKLNTKWKFNQGFKDALIAGEETYWIGITNGEPDFRKVNPINLTVILDDDCTFIDDAVAVIEERMLTIPSILDEYGDELREAKQLDKLIEYTRGTFGSFNTAGGFEPAVQMINGQAVFSGITPTTAFQGNNTNNYSIRVARVEWISMKKIGYLSYTDKDGLPVEDIVDDTFASSFKIFKELYPDAEVEWDWINEAWEGIKIGTDIYIGVRAKVNQRRRMDNPYYCKHGYTGYIYEATNSRSVSLIDRLKPYQYLYDIIAFRLELAFASDQGKIFLMDLAQIPRSEGIDIDQWMYYLKEMKIGFINSFEEGKKSQIGKTSSFNQFQSIDLSLANSIQQYINYLQYIEQQIFTVSGITPQRLGAISSSELVGNTERAVNQSSLITEYLFNAHAEVQRRVYTALIEVAKIAYKDGLVQQYVTDDMGVEMLHIEPFEFENSEFSVFISVNSKDKEVKLKLDQLSQVALEQQKADLSTIIDTILNDSPKDIVAILRKAEEDFYGRQDQQAKAQQEHEAKMTALQVQHEQEARAFEAGEKQKDRDKDIYIADSNNRTKIAVQEIANYFKAADTDADQDGTPDPLEIGAQALEQQALASKHFVEQQKLSNDRSKHDREISLKEKELRMKQDVENKKIDAIRVQNKSQELMQDKQIKLKKEEMKNKLEVEKLKIKAKPKPTTKKK